MPHLALCLHFFNPVFQVSTAKNEINLFNNHILIVAPVTFAPAGAMSPSAEFLSYFSTKTCCRYSSEVPRQLSKPIFCIQADSVDPDQTAPKGAF